MFGRVLGQRTQLQTICIRFYLDVCCRLALTFYNSMWIWYCVVSAMDIRLTESTTTARQIDSGSSNTHTHTQQKFIKSFTLINFSRSIWEIGCFIVILNLMTMNEFVFMHLCGVCVCVCCAIAAFCLLLFVVVAVVLDETNDRTEKDRNSSWGCDGERHRTWKHNG